MHYTVYIALHLTFTLYIVVVFSCVLRLELAKFSVSVVTVQPGDFSKATNLLNSHHRCSTAPGPVT